MSGNKDIKWVMYLHSKIIYASEKKVGRREKYFSEQGA